MSFDKCTHVSNPNPKIMNIIIRLESSIMPIQLIPLITPIPQFLLENFFY